MVLIQQCCGLLLSCLDYDIMVCVSQTAQAEFNTFAVLFLSNSIYNREGHWVRLSFLNVEYEIYKHIQIRIYTVMKNVETSWNLYLGISRPEDVLKKSWKFSFFVYAIQLSSPQIIYIGCDFREQSVVPQSETCHTPELASGSSSSTFPAVPFTQMFLLGTMPLQGIIQHNIPALKGLWERSPWL